MNTILVTGGTGLVGNAIKKISNQYDEYNFIFVSSKQFNLIKMEDTKKMFEIYKPKYVIHLAASVGGLFKNMNYKVDMLEKNLLINFNVIKCAHDYKVEKLIACLSTCIFPDNVTYPIDESMLHNGPPHFSNDAYAYAKRMLEIHCHAYRENYGDNFICIIPTNIYGPHDNFDLQDGHVLPALIHKCFIAKKENKDFVICGTGKPLRQFIYSEDLGKLIMKIFELNIKENIILSVPESHEISIGQVGKLIAKEFNYDKIIFDSNFSDGQYKKTVSIDKLISLIGRIEFTKIEDGIKNTVSWFIENH
jgi:GDP-L-fucose synthase